VEARGSPSRQATFYGQFSIQRAHETRYWIYDETLASGQMAVQLAEKGIGEHNLAYCLGNLGEHCLWRGDLDQAQENLQAALALSERSYDRNCHEWCLSNLCLVGIRRHDVEAVRTLSLQLSTALEGYRNRVRFVGLSSAVTAWVAWKDGRFDDVVSRATQVLGLWRGLPFVYFFKGLCLWPLMSVQLASGDIAASVNAGCVLVLAANL
jgi:hypothetical protein